MGDSNVCVKTGDYSKRYFDSEGVSSYSITIYEILFPCKITSEGVSRVYRGHFSSTYLDSEGALRVYVDNGFSPLYNQSKKRSRGFVYEYTAGGHLKIFSPCSSWIAVII